MRATNAALGCKVHTGWAALVVLAGAPGDIRVLLRERIELLPSGGAIPRFVYHQAAEMDLPKAAQLVEAASTAACDAALQTLRRVLDSFKGRKIAIKHCGIPTGSVDVPRELSSILASHPLIHTAEGALYQQAVISACRACGIAVTAVRERDLYRRAAEAYALEESRLVTELAGLRQFVGAPWGADQKVATAAALLSLQPH